MRGLRGATLSAAWALFAGTAPLPGQTDPAADTLELRLAADPERNGPAAWIRIRAALPELLGDSWPTDLDPSDALRLRADLRGRSLRAEPAPDPVETTYLEARGRWGGWRLEGSGTHDGLERWLLARGEGTAPERLMELGWLLHLAPDTGLREFETAPLVAHLLSASAEGDPWTGLLLTTATDCGRLQLTLQSGPDRDTIQARGTSGGGVLLPAAIALLADWHRHPPTVAGNPFAGRQPADVERWLLTAWSGAAEDRQEAARQLARFDQPRAERALRDLLLDDPVLRDVAMGSLLRSSDGDCLPDLVAAAAAGSTDHTRALATLGLEALLPRSGSPARKATLRRLARDGETALLATAESVTQYVPEETPAEETGDRPWRMVLLGVLACSAAALAFEIRRARF